MLGPAAAQHLPLADLFSQANSKQDQSPLARDLDGKLRDREKTDPYLRLLVKDCRTSGKQFLPQKLIAAAQTHAEEWSTASPAALRDFVKKVVRRVIVQTEKMDVETSRSELRAILTKNQLRAESQNAILDDLVRLTLQARLKRCGGEMRLVLSRDSAEPEMVTPIVKAVVRAHRWREGILAGDISIPTPVKKRFDIRGEYLRRVLGCAFLAPDILEAMLDGHQPANLTLKKLTRRRLPLDWAEQRVQFGFPARACGHRSDS